MSYLDAAHDAGMRGQEARQYAEWMEHLDYQQQQQYDAEYQRHAVEAQCDDEGHIYHGDEFDQAYIDAGPGDQRDEIRAAAGRCYCGARRFPLGGPHPDQVGEPG